MACTEQPGVPWRRRISRLADPGFEETISTDSTASSARAADQSVKRGDAPIYLVWEEVDAIPDEGYDRFSGELVKALGAIHPVISHATPKKIPGRAGVRFIVRQLSMLAAVRKLASHGRRPRAIVYASRHELTVPGLLRARLLRWFGRAPLVIMVLVPNHASRPALRLLRWLAPEGILLGTEREIATVRRHGVDAELIWSGVDTSRFRPGDEAEKRSLRRHYGLPTEDRIVLHVGHLRGSRGLEALLPLGSTAGITVLLVVSHRRWPDSEQVKAELERHGVVVMEGYQARVEEIYRLADCYVFPGGDDRAVSLPLSILEAAASGLPVVSVRYEAVPERLAAVDGIEFVEDSSVIPARVLAVMGSRRAARELPAELGWDGVARTVLAAVESAIQRR